MSDIPENLLYSNSHEWLRVEDGIGLGSARHHTPSRPVP